VGAWIFAAGDPLAAAGGVGILRNWAIEPLAISGVVSLSPLGIKETQAATQLPCLTARELQAGNLNGLLQEATSKGACGTFGKAGSREGFLNT
jgi:hypothetical protein